MKVATFGEIMMRFSTISNNKITQSDSFKISFAGSEANVAVALSYWGLNSKYLTALPNNDLGHMVLLDLNKYKIDTSSIILNENKRLGLLFIESGANQKPSKVIYDRKYSAFSQERFNKEYFKNALSGSNWLHWSGITPGTSQISIQNIINALEVAKDLNMKISCDLNYRNKLWDFGVNCNDIMPDLLTNANIIMGNEEDATLMLGLKSKNNCIGNGKIQLAVYKDICKEIFDKYAKCEIIAFSLRKSISANHNNWSAILATRDTFIHSKEYEIKNIVDRVGAGDSFSAGIIYGLSVYKNNLKKVLEFATAASCLKHSINGDYCLSKKEEVLKLIDGNSSGRIVR